MGSLDHIGTLLKAAAENNKADEIAKILGNVSEFYSLELICDWSRGVGFFNDPTPITVAAEHGNTDCVRKIIELGGNLYSVGRPENVYVLDHERPAFVFLSESYFGALVIAASKGNIDIVTLLVEYRLFEVPKIQGEYSDFVKAAKEGDFQKIKCLLETLKNKDAYLKGWKGHNIMNLCLLLGCPSSYLQTMVDHGIGVNGWDYNGLTPLMCAILGSNVECVKFLLDKDADPYEIHILRRMSFQDDGTVLYIDRRGRVMDYLESDFKHDWSAFRGEDVGCSALLYAAAIGNVPILKMMLDAAPKDIVPGARIERFFNYGVLNLAVYYANSDAVSQILEYATATERKDQDILASAVRREKTEMFEFLLDKLVVERGWNCEMALRTCVEYNNTNYLKKMLDVIRMNVFEIDEAGGLFSAIKENIPECLDLFIKRPEFSTGLKCTSGFLERAYGLTSFMFSCRVGRYEFAKTFYEMGANVNEVDDEGKTATMYAARYDQVKCLEFLLDEAHAEFDAVDAEGGTVLSAALMGDGDGLTFLMKAGVLFDGELLKSVHKTSVKVCGMRRGEYTDEDFNRPVKIKNMQSLTQKNVFHWDWCTLHDKFSMRNIIFAAVTSGIPLGKLTYNNQKMSPFMYALLIKQVAVARYLLANRYFHYDDYRFLLSDADIKDLLKFDNAPMVAFVVNQLTFRPLPLEYWSVMAILEMLAPSNSGAASGDRTEKVDMLPLPESLKNVLKSKKISQLCPRLWHRLGPQEGENNEAKFDDFVRNGKVLKHPTLVKCVNPCLCGGLGYSIE